ncbi:MAG: signal peptidase I [Acidobacteriota bacterium]
MTRRSDETTTSERTPLRSRVRGFLREAVGLAAIVLLVAAARSTLADHYHVPSGSMRPSVEIGDRILVNKLAYGIKLPLVGTTLVDLDEPEVGDVVVLSSPEDGTVLLKRIAAGPGDVVGVHRGQVWRNGQPLPIHHDGEWWQEAMPGHQHPVLLSGGGGPELEPVRVPPGHFLVLGDNRGQSHDGRLFGFVERDAILGRVLGVFAREGRPTWQSF